MTNAHTITAEDWLKYIRAQGRWTLECITNQIAGHADIPDAEAEDMCDSVGSVSSLLAEAPLIDPNHYSDGRAVVSHLELERGNTFQHVWHPDPANERNALGDVCTWTTTSGIRKRIMIAAHGVLDAVTALEVVR